jgi:undecaprenyl-diphosphatase
MLTALDQQISILVTENRSDFLTAIFSVFSFLGNWQFIVLAMLLIIIVLALKKKTLFIAPFILAVAGSSFLTYLGKLYFARPRPLYSVFMETGFSLPSGHATVAVAFFACLAFILVKLNFEKKSGLIYSSAILIILLIGFSRIYLGAHYLTDILAGYLIGLVGLIFGIIWTKKSLNRV